jgi:hypothetical protein
MRFGNVDQFYELALFGNSPIMRGKKGREFGKPFYPSRKKSIARNGPVL